MKKPPHTPIAPHFQPARFCAAMLLVLGGCSHPGGDASSMDDREKKSIESAVINRFNEMIKYAEAGELENVLSYFDPSADGSYIDGATRYASFQDMADSWRATWKVQKQDYGVPDTKVIIFSPALVLVSANSTLNTTNKYDVVFRPRPWSLTTLWHLQEGEWFIHSFHQYSGDLVKVDPAPSDDD